MLAIKRFKVCGLLGVFLAVLIMLNVGVFYNNYHSRVSGSFFAQGKMILSTGDEVKMASRINFFKTGLLEFQKSWGWSRSAYREVVGRMGGDFISRTVSARSEPITKLSPAFDGDDDAFSQVYYLKVGGELTYINIYSGDEGNCFYVKELVRTRCFGVSAE
ncbi:hypothetical protein BLL42_28255 (plasmid) [Pseudomonas frederiksbergensis]|uniref:Uncharacterized protein n=1 Tax=Pseudomonas frederiksbergensis TaxID=104087 RepID=A0A1J0EUE0_9PSED|nr:hypothetical protein [Pseudomonas frederiksbergensis]APC19606.1 hypothetical protein BLL42_28255 [Pseudomonas frederiksbergensis]